jgi:hypothetical protein
MNSTKLLTKIIQLHYNQLPLPRLFPIYRNLQYYKIIDVLQSARLHQMRANSNTPVLESRGTVDELFRTLLNYDYSPSEDFINKERREFLNGRSTE